MKYRGHIAALAFIVLFSPAGAFCLPKFPAETVSVGTAVVSGGNEARAREDAMADAVFRAFSQYLAEGLGIESVQAHFRRIKEGVFPRAGEIAENFLILAEHRSGSSLSVLLKVRFNRKLVEDLLNDAGVPLSGEERHLRILLMTAEGTDGRYTFWWKDPTERYSLSPVELAVRKAFERRGFMHVDSGAVIGRDILPSLKDRNLDDARIAEWGRLYGADFVLYGASNLNSEGELELSLKALSAGDGSTVAEAIRFAVVDAPVADMGNFLPALESVSSGVAEVLAPAMLRLKTSETGSRVVKVIFEGADVLVDSPRLQRYMEEKFSGVTLVRPARLGRNRIAFEVGYRGDPRLLAERLASEGSPFPVRSTLDGDGNIRVKRSGSFDRPDRVPKPVEDFRFGS